ncbi:MAG: DEAD/DEAH box helicase [Planctomycetota bacterium]|jgi:hypothetical protein
MPILLNRFLDSFGKAIDAEMAAMRERMGPSEISLILTDPGEELPSDECRKAFRMVSPSEKLIPGMDCSVRFRDGERRTTLEQVLDDVVLLRADRPFPDTLSEPSLIVYPWFLYERLRAALADLGSEEHVYPENALALFGQGEVVRDVSSSPVKAPSSLNDSQRNAVALCRESSHAFIWGPPGTGKTTTLAEIIAALVEDGNRVLVASTTNAAVDQALAKLAENGSLTEAFEQGAVLRIGLTAAETHGADLYTVRNRLQASDRTALTQIRRRAEKVHRRLQDGRPLLETLQASSGPRQASLFGEGGAASLTGRELTALFPEERARRLGDQTPAEQKAVVEQRLNRLEAILPLYEARVEAIWQRLHDAEARIAAEARVTFSTLANVTLSPLLAGLSYDVVVIEEAGMAILPSLFYVASLAEKKVIAVGDPRQLPPITQSKEDIVHRAMGRNIFEVAGAEEEGHGHTAMLDTQYRMVPKIGDLVNDLYYGGRLHHDPCTEAHHALSEMPPRAGEPIVVIDTQGRFPCEIQEGGFSRYNEKHALLCVELAEEAYLAGLESIAIITPYAEQARRISKALEGARIPMPSIECATVHRFQGHEKDMVILDTVDTAPHRPGVLLSGTAPGSQAMNLLNVSVSRARGKLVLIADVGYFEERAPRSPVTQLLERAQGRAVKPLPIRRPAASPSSPQLQRQPQQQSPRPRINAASIAARLKD